MSIYLEKDEEVREVERTVKPDKITLMVWWCPFCDHSNQDGNTRTRTGELGCSNCQAVIIDWEARVEAGQGESEDPAAEPTKDSPDEAPKDDPDA